MTGPEWVSLVSLLIAFVAAVIAAYTIGKGRR